MKYIIVDEDNVEFFYSKSSSNISIHNNECTLLTVSQQTKNNYKLMNLSFKIFYTNIIIFKNNKMVK